MTKTTPWLKIKAEYLQGVTPKELALKYKIKAKTIHDKASKEKWSEEKTSICENLRENTADEIKRLTAKALSSLEEVLDDESAKNSDIVSACKAILDISGLKSSKQEITGKDGSPLGERIVYVTPEEQKEVREHIRKMIGD